MMNGRRLKISRQSQWEYISIFALILECSSIYFNQNKWNIISSNTALMIGFLPLTIRALFYFASHTSARRFFSKAFLGYLLFAGIYMITLGKSELINFTMKFIIIFPCIFVYVLYLIITGKFGRYIKRYIKIVSLIAFFSLCFWFFGSIIGILKPTGTLPYTWGSMQRTANSYFNLYFETQTEQTIFGVWRNTAFFTEAPKYGLILTIAYLFNYVSERNRKTVVLLAVTIMSTFSFTAIIGLILVHFIVYTMKIGRDILTKKAKIRTLVWPILIAIALIAVSFLMVKKIETSSGVGRLGDFAVCFAVGIKHPLFGWGFLDNEYLNTVLHSYRLASGVGNTMGLSNSISQIFVDGGLYLLAFYLIPIVNLIKSGWKKSDKWFSFGIILLYLFVTTYFAYSGIMFFVLSMGYSVYLLKRTKRLRPYKQKCGEVARWHQNKNH